MQSQRVVAHLQCANLLLALQQGHAQLLDLRILTGPLLNLSVLNLDRSAGIEWIAFNMVLGTTKRASNKSWPFEDWILFLQFLDSALVVSLILKSGKMKPVGVLIEKKVGLDWVRKTYLVDEIPKRA
jgi:hypothetical protein